MKTMMQNQNSANSMNQWKNEMLDAERTKKLAWNFVNLLEYTNIDDANKSEEHHNWNLLILASFYKLIVTNTINKLLNE